MLNRDFGCWHVLYKVQGTGKGNKGKGRALWHCRCKCGTERDVLEVQLTKDRTHSCGCLRYPGREYISRENIIGISKHMKCGLSATIIACQNKRNIDIVFEDGAERKNILYQSFQKGNVLHPDFVGKNPKTGFFHGFTNVKKVCEQYGNVYYSCVTPDGVSDILTLQDMLAYEKNLTVKAKESLCGQGENI